MRSADSNNDDRDKTLLLIKVYLLNIQKETLAFSDKINTEINGIVFEIDRALSSERHNV